MDYEMIEKMSVPELKNFLKIRALKLSGNKKELVARVFCAIENDILPVASAEETERELKSEYLGKLKVGTTTIPDPFKISAGWKDEESSMAFWPVLLYPDIFNYLMFFPSQLGSKDLSDYKTSKAYSYYQKGWLQPLMYHDLSGSKFCLFKGECRPSQKINNENHRLWLLLEKSGKIVSCHCTCMAGMGQTCNHVAAAMYRIEATVRIGLTNPACTSSANKWLPPAVAKNDVPKKIKDMNFNREGFGSYGKKKRHLVSSPKKRYQPFLNVEMKALCLNDFAEVLENICPESILFTAVPKPEIDFCKEIITSPLPDIEKNSHITIRHIITNSKSAEEFYNGINEIFSEEYVGTVEKKTRGQSSNESWYEYRKGVITASKAHSVCTKVEKIRKPKGGIVDVWSLNQRISGLTFTNPDIPALKYGRSMEGEAANVLFEILRRNHKNLVFSESGLLLHAKYPFLGASPDRLVKCECCGNACLEIKCPFSINYEKPSVANASYLVENENGEPVLKQNHQYYIQCLMQLFYS